MISYCEEPEERTKFSNLAWEEGEMGRGPSDSVLTFDFFVVRGLTVLLTAGSPLAFWKTGKQRKKEKRYLLLDRLNSSYEPQFRLQGRSISTRKNPSLRLLWDFFVTHVKTILHNLECITGRLAATHNYQQDRFSPVLTWLASEFKLLWADIDEVVRGCWRAENEDGDGWIRDGVWPTVLKPLWWDRNWW